jgi:hypothetical protein
MLSIGIHSYKISLTFLFVKFSGERKQGEENIEGLLGDNDLRNQLPKTV